MLLKIDKPLIAKCLKAGSFQLIPDFNYLLIRYANKFYHQYNQSAILAFDYTNPNKQFNPHNWNDPLLLALRDKLDDIRIFEETKCDIISSNRPYTGVFLVNPNFSEHKFLISWYINKKFTNNMLNYKLEPMTTSELIDIFKNYFTVDEIFKLFVKWQLV